MNLKSQSTNLSQKVLLEVLVTEIESLKKSKKEYDKILEATTANIKRLEELYHKPINIDIKPFQAEHLDIQHTLRRFITLPKWAFWTLLVCIAITGGSIAYTLNKETAFDKVLDRGYYWHNEYQNLAKRKGK